MLRLLNTLFVFIVATIFYWLGLLMFSPLGISVNIMFLKRISEKDINTPI